MGKGKGTAVEKARAPVPHRSKYFSSLATLRRPDLPLRYSEPALACHSKRHVGTDDRAYRGDASVVVPGFAMPRSEYGSENVRTGECWNWSAVGNREKEQTEYA